LNARADGRGEAENAAGLRADPAVDPTTCLDGPALPSCDRRVSDLAAIDIERGRDHGMPYDNDLRAADGLEPRN
jgi:hypothetical protein